MTLQSRRVRSVYESRCDWLRRTIEAVLCELTRCWSVLASRCRSSGPGGLSGWQLVCRVCSLSRWFVIESTVCCKKLVNSVDETCLGGALFRLKWCEGASTYVDRTFGGIEWVIAEEQETRQARVTTPTARDGDRRRGE